MLLSMILPITALLILISEGTLLTKNAPDAVTVFCEVGVRMLPYSRGKRYCLSAVQKCEDVTPMHLSANPPLINTEAQMIDSIAVEHAP
jgi:hypothetical protein